MATPGAEFSTLRRKFSTPPRSLSPAETELEAGIQDLEKKIANHRRYSVARSPEGSSRSNQIPDGRRWSCHRNLRPVGRHLPSQRRPGSGDGFTSAARLGIDQGVLRNRPDRHLRRHRDRLSGAPFDRKEFEFAIRRGRAIADAKFGSGCDRGPFLPAFCLQCNANCRAAARCGAPGRCCIRGRGFRGTGQTSIGRCRIRRISAGARAATADTRGNRSCTVPSSRAPRGTKARIADGAPVRGSPPALAADVFRFFHLVRTRQQQAPSIRTATSASTQPALSKPEAAAVAIHPEASEPSLRSAVPARPSKSLPSPVSQPAAESRAVVAENPKVESQAAGSNRPVLPGLVIQGLPPGTQVFVDDRFFVSTNSTGQASIATLADGVHHLRLKFNGYRDYDQNLDIQSGKTSTVTAKLEPLELPVLTERPKAPILEVSPAIPRAGNIHPPFASELRARAHS